MTRKLKAVIRNIRSMPFSDTAPEKKDTSFISFVATAHGGFFCCPSFWSFYRRKS
jgi:hypothetical protein